MQKIEITNQIKYIGADDKKSHYLKDNIICQME